jgi:hypothetical protein
MFAFGAELGFLVLKSLGLRLDPANGLSLLGLLV